MTFRSQDLKYLVDTHGKPLTLVVKAEGAYDPDTGLLTSTTTDYTVQVYFYNYNLGDVDGVNVQRGDRRAVLPSLILSVTLFQNQTTETKSLVRVIR
jgi:hypothetical protein